MALLDFLTKTVGVDPGSQNLRLVHNDQLVFNETTELSLNPETNKVSGYGNESIHEGQNKVIKPVNTVIADFHGFEHLLRGALIRALNERTWFPSSYRMYFSIPISSTTVEQRAYRDAGEHAGAKEVHLIHQPCSAAIGMKILFEKKDFVLVDFSASKVEITVFSNSVPVAEGTIRMGIWKFKTALRNYIFRNHKITPSEKELEFLLFNLPNLGEIHKIDHASISTVKLKETLNPYFAIIEDQFLETLEQASNNHRINQILLNGIYFTGGGSYVNWLTERIALKGKMKVQVSSDPLLDTINGVREVLKKPEFYKGFLMT